MGKFIQKIEEMEQVVYHLRVVLYGVTKLQITTLKQGLDNKNLSKLKRTSSKQVEQDNGVKNCATSFTGDSPRKRKDTGVELDLSADLSSDESDYEELQKNAERMEIARSIIEAM